MPRVESNAEVTLVVLVYRSLRWLDWCIDQTDRSQNATRYRWLVVANDATDDVIGGLLTSDLKWVDIRNGNPEEHYINRVYRAWNRGVAEAPTERVIMLNSDMAGSDYWIDQLLYCHHHTFSASPLHASVSTSLLVESGRIPSGMPEHVREFGTNPDNFDEEGFREHASGITKPGLVEPGRLYMPILVNRQEFLDLGGYPNGNPPGTTGDKDLIRRYKAAGFEHVTALGSVLYHCQEGEMRWP